MYTLLILIFENEIGAQNMLGNVQALQRKQMITIADAAFVIRQKDEKIKVKQANSLVGAGALGGAFWGLFIGQYFWTSPSRSNIETGPFAFDNSLNNAILDCGIDADFLKLVGSAISPGYSALFLIVAYMTEEILNVLAGYSSTLLQTTLSGESAAKLRDAFGIVE